MINQVHNGRHTLNGLAYPAVASSRPDTLRFAICYPPKATRRRR
jgi:hypothetical protein